MVTSKDPRGNSDVMQEAVDDASKMTSSFSIPPQSPQSLSPRHSSAFLYQRQSCILSTANPCHCFPLGFIRAPGDVVPGPPRLLLRPT